MEAGRDGSLVSWCFEGTGEFILTVVEQRLIVDERIVGSTMSLRRTGIILDEIGSLNAR